jgi:hypothetical protein
MIIFITKVIFFILVILTVSLAIFATLVKFVGTFFNVTVAPDSMFATMIAKFRKP